MHDSTFIILSNIELITFRLVSQPRIKHESFPSGHYLISLNLDSNWRMCKTCFVKFACLANHRECNCSLHNVYLFSSSIDRQLAV
jgi:hypothetical protein